MCYYIAMSNGHLSSTIDQVEPKPSFFKRHDKASRAIGAALIVAAGAYAYASKSNQASSLEKQINRLEQSESKLQRQFNDSNANISRLLNQNPGFIDGSLFNKTIKPTTGHVAPAIVNLHKDAAVELLERPKDSDSSWAPLCTADKVSLGGLSYVLTANHCFGSQENLPEKGGGPDLSFPAAINITSSLSEQFAVGAPTKTSYPPAGKTAANWNVYGLVSGVAVDESRDADWAMVSVRPTKAFKSLPALNLNHAPVVEQNDKGTSGAGQLGYVGEPASLYSMPGANGSRPVEATGTYLGEIGPSGYGTSLLYEVVGIDPSVPSDDSCNYGSSGSVAILSNGNITGPLAERNNIGYGYYDTFFSPDSPQADESDRVVIEQELGNLNLSKFSTLCLYSEPVSTAINGVATATTYTELANALEGKL